VSGCERGRSSEDHDGGVPKFSITPVIDGMASTYKPLPSDDVTSPEKLHPPAKRTSYRRVVLVAVVVLFIVGFASYKTGRWSVIRLQPASVLAPTTTTADIPKPIPTGMATDTALHSQGKYSVG
jgi:hypothetical protein